MEKFRTLVRKGRNSFLILGGFLILMLTSSKIEHFGKRLDTQDNGLGLVGFAHADVPAGDSAGDSGGDSASDSGGGSSSGGGG